MVSERFMDDEKYWQPCTFIKFDNSTNSPYWVKCDSGYTHNVPARYIRLMAPSDARNNTPPKNNTTPEQNEEARENQAAQSAGCSSDATLTAKPTAGDAMELTFKRSILENYQSEVEQKNSVTAPLGVGISFESFQIGQPYVNRRTTDGTYVKDAPVDAKMYPVKTKYTVCKRYHSGIQQTLIDGRYKCFVNNFGEWMCSYASGWRTLETR